LATFAKPLLLIRDQHARAKQFPYHLCRADTRLSRVRERERERYERRRRIGRHRLTREASRKDGGEERKMIRPPPRKRERERERERKRERERQERAKRNAAA